MRRESLTNSVRSCRNTSNWDKQRRYNHHFRMLFIKHSICRCIPCGRTVAPLQNCVLCLMHQPKHHLNLSSTSSNDEWTVGPTSSKSLREILELIVLHSLQMSAACTEPSFRLKLTKISIVSFGESNLWKTNAWLGSPLVWPPHHSLLVCVKSKTHWNVLSISSCCWSIQQVIFVNVNDGLTGADTVDGAVCLQRELQSMFSLAGFHLCKWNSSESSVLRHNPTEVQDSSVVQLIGEVDTFTKILGIEKELGSSGRLAKIVFN